LKEKKSAEHREQFNKRVDVEASSSEKQFNTIQHLRTVRSTASAAKNESVKGSSSRTQTSDSICSSKDEQHDATDEFIAPAIPASYQICKSRKRRGDILSHKIVAVLDCTNTSIRTSTMILASVINDSVCSTSSAVLSRSTVHRVRQKCRREAAENIKEDYRSSESDIIHWDGQLLPDMTGIDCSIKVDHQPILISSE